MVAIIVLNWNGRDCLPRCLTSLEALSYPDKEIIVVDNGSSDDSLAHVKRDFPHCLFIENGGNLGFASGMNRGIRLALERGADYVWLFNYDAEAAPDALSLLIDAATSHPEAGLLSPAITGPDGALWFGKGRIDFLRMRALHVAPSSEELSSVAYPSPFLTGCALLINKATIEKIGFLDEDFFLYYEDADYCLRARKAGLQCLVVPKARVMHAEKSQENPEKTYYLVLSGLLFSAKHTPKLLRPYLAGYATIRRLKNRLDLLCGRDKAETVARAFKDFAR
jgi:hypothetical protein